MKQITISRDSWHYRVMNIVLDDIPVDVCAYIRRAFFILIGALFGLVIIGFFTWLIGDFLVWIAWMLLNLSWIAPEAEAIIVSVISLFALIIFIISKGQAGELDYLLKSEGAQLVSAAYESVHDKVCFKIIYK